MAYPACGSPLWTLSRVLRCRAHPDDLLAKANEVHPPPADVLRLPGRPYWNGPPASALACLGLFVLDWRAAESISRFEVWREHDTRLSLAAENSVRLFVRNRGRRPASLWLRDEPPDAFQTETYILAGQAGPGQTWRGVYRVRPPRRGDYEFGNLNLLWLGPLGLVVRQARFEAAGPVKVYPNLLDVRRYDLFAAPKPLAGSGAAPGPHVWGGD